MIDIYLKADQSTFYYFSYFRGVMMTQASNREYHSIIVNTKPNVARHPDSSLKVPYSYMIAVENRLERFIQRMTGGDVVEEPSILDGLIR